MIKFAHKRVVDTNTGCPAGKGGCTMAYQQIGTDQYEFALAKCHERDAFHKAQGRVKSAGRLLSPKHRVVFNGTRDQLLELFLHADEYLRTLRNSL